MGRPYAEVIGDPIAHSKSPVIHNFWIDKLGIDAEYRLTQVRPDQLQDYLESRRADPDWLGCNVTMPLKEKIIPLLDLVDEQATRIGAVNTVIRDRELIGGTNTDAWGVLCAVGMFEAKDPVIVIGTGGAARTVLYHLHGINALDVQIFGQGREKGRRLLDAFELSGDAWSLDETPSIFLPMMLINATPLGMTGQPPMPQSVFDLLDQLQRGSGVFDMIYEPWETKLLREARRRGFHASNGSGMLISQARSAFEHFFGARPSVSLDDELCQRLTS